MDNEEIYYFRIGRAGATDTTPTASACTACTRRRRRRTVEIDETVEVRDGDVFLIPRGYHGPCIAAPGYTMYYLNVLAGPGGERSRWRSATTRPTTGSATPGRAWPSTRASR